MIAYVEHSFSPAVERIIEQAEAICAEYQAQGFDLTLRQLYYQFVARGFIPNRDTEYKRLGAIINDARMAGRLDWDYIVDRTRNLRELGHWRDPAQIVREDASVFNVDRWENQRERVEVWIEKDALVGVIEGVCQRNDVPFFSCRGYTSQSEMWGASQRINAYFDGNAERVTIVHLGDHDPSGIDMSRDIEDRLRRFLRYHDDENGTEHADFDFEVERIALNMDQVRRLNPPPNPAKITDSRAKEYIRRFGGTSWELDALDPRTLDGLIAGAIDAHRDDDQWALDTERQGAGRAQLRTIGQRWSDVVAFLADKNGHSA